LARSPQSRKKAPEVATTRANQEAYLQGLLDQGGRVSDAIKVAGVTLAMVKNWRENVEGFRDLEEECQLFHDDKIRERVDEELYVEKNERILLAAMKKLPEYNPARKTEVNVSGTVEHIAKLDTAEKDALILEAAECIEAEYEVVPEKD
jgi:hypothetical protein